MQSALKLDVLELKMSQCPGALPLNIHHDHPIETHKENG